jgi:hypothetical protein
MFSFFPDAFCSSVFKEEINYPVVDTVDLIVPLLMSVIIQYLVLHQGTPQFHTTTSDF